MKRLERLGVEPLVAGSSFEAFTVSFLPEAAGPDEEAADAEAAALGLPHWNLQAFAPPDSVDPLQVQLPAVGSWQRLDPALTSAATPRGQINDSLGLAPLVGAKRDQRHWVERCWPMVRQARPSLRQSVLHIKPAAAKGSGTPLHRYPRMRPISSTASAR